MRFATDGERRMPVEHVAQQACAAARRTYDKDWRLTSHTERNLYAANGAFDFSNGLAHSEWRPSLRTSLHVLVPISQARGRWRLLPQPPIPPELLFRNLGGLHPVIPDARKLFDLPVDSIEHRKTHASRQGQN